MSFHEIFMSLRLLTFLKFSIRRIENYYYLQIENYYYLQIVKLLLPSDRKLLLPSDRKLLLSSDRKLLLPSDRKLLLPSDQKLCYLPKLSTDPSSYIYSERIQTDLKFKFTWVRVNLLIGQWIQRVYFSNYKNKFETVWRDWIIFGVIF